MASPWFSHLMQPFDVALPAWPVETMWSVGPVPTMDGLQEIQTSDGAPASVWHAEPRGKTESDRDARQQTSRTSEHDDGPPWWDAEPDDLAPAPEDWWPEMPTVPAAGFAFVPSPTWAVQGMLRFDPVTTGSGDDLAGRGPVPDATVPPDVPAFMWLSDVNAAGDPTELRYEVVRDGNMSLAVSVDYKVVPREGSGIDVRNLVEFDVPHGVMYLDHAQAVAEVSVTIAPVTYVGPDGPVLLTDTANLFQLVIQNPRAADGGLVQILNGGQPMTTDTVGATGLPALPVDTCGADVFDFAQLHEGAEYDAAPLGRRHVEVPDTRPMLPDVDIPLVSLPEDWDLLG